MLQHVTVISTEVTLMLWISKYQQVYQKISFHIVLNSIIFQVEYNLEESQCSCIVKHKAIQEKNFHPLFFIGLQKCCWKCQFL